MSKKTDNAIAKVKQMAANKIRVEKEVLEQVKEINKSIEKRRIEIGQSKNQTAFKAGIPTWLYNNTLDPKKAPTMKMALKLLNAVKLDFILQKKD